MARHLPHKRAARAAAISIITLAAALAVLWCAPRASDAVAAWLRTPHVRAATLTVDGGLSLQPVPRARASTSAPGRTTSTDAARAVAVTLDAGLRFTMLGVTCAVPAYPDGVLVDLRTSLDGTTWSRWYTTSLDVGSDADSRDLQAFTEAIWTGPGRWVQVAARPVGSKAAPTALRDVRVVAIDSTERADAVATVVGVVRRTAAVIAGFRLVPPASAMTDKPVIVSRQEWGADETYRSGTPDYATPTMAFVHHTDSGNDYGRAEAAAVVRGAYYYHTRSLHWSDIGYNFLVDRYGTIYEGRYGGVTKGVIGAQVLGFNTGSIGVSVVGTYSKVAPTAASIRSLEALLAWKLDVHHVDPQGKTTLTCGYGEKFATGERVVFPAIAGHRDANYTECPGNKLYPQLPDIRKRVAALGQPKIYDVDVDGAYISPGGDGVRDGVTLTARLSAQAEWKLVVGDASGDTVRSVSGSGTAVDSTWSGRDNAGKVVPDGEYTLSLSASNADGDARPATAMVRVDTTPPQLQSAAVDPSPFSPNGDGQGDTASVSFKPGESGTARVTVLGEDDRVDRTLLGWRSVGPALKTVAWDGRVNRSGKLVDAPEGKAVIVVEMRDLAGNSDSVRRSVVVDRTLGFPAVKPASLSPNGDGDKDQASLSFKLTRRADVKVRVLEGDQSVRVIDAGSLPAGDHAVTWDGSGPGGSAPVSGVYQVKVTADGSVGVSAVTVPVTVDLTAPRFTVPATVSGKAGKTVKLSYTVRDKYSPTVKVSVTVTGASGATVATVACGWVKQGAATTFSWKPPAKGAYVLTFGAADRAGNDAAAAVSRLTAR